MHPLSWLLLPMLCCALALPNAWAGGSIQLQGRCKTSGTLCVATIGNSGGGVACCDPADSQTLNECVRTNPCESPFPLHWDASQLPLQWSWNPNGQIGKAGFKHLTEQQLESSLKAAWDSWQLPCSSFRHKYLGRTKTTPNYFDKAVVLYFASPAEWAQLGLSGGVIAFSAPRGDDRGKMLDGDIVYNPTVEYTAEKDESGNKQHFQYVTAHEIGHSLGLAHTHATALMYYRVRPGAQPTPDTDDTQILCKIYPNTKGCKDPAQCAACYTCSNDQCTHQNPAPVGLCTPCQKDSDCPTNSLCTAMADGLRHCLLRCNATQCCPDGTRCEEVAGKSLCIPKQTHCPLRSCKFDEECPSPTRCLQGKCNLPTQPAHRLCATTCLKDTDCKAPNRCLTLGKDTKTEQRRCVTPCTQDQFCPVGYICRSTPSGRLCTPQHENLCPCAQNDDCESGKICRNGLCQRADGGKILDPCSDKAPCANGLQCLNAYSTSGLCIQTCTTTPKDSCPNGYVCTLISSATYACLPKGTQARGETCDELHQRCLPGLRCVTVTEGDAKGVCIPECTADGRCPRGGVCNPTRSYGELCLCSKDYPCNQGNTCKTIAKGQNGDFGICLCPATGCSTACGDGTCDASTGENCSTCPGDCGCPLSVQCINGACLKCGNKVCDANENCSLCPLDCACSRGLRCNQGTCSNCGNNICEPNFQENCVNCPSDCPCNSKQVCQNNRCVDLCGDGTCDPAGGESCASCPTDCACRQGLSCNTSRGTCTQMCGNGTCDLNAGENCESCATDCSCASTHVCQSGACLDKAIVCTGRFVRKCDAKGKNCREECQPGCGCSSTQNPDASGLLLLLLVLLLRRRRAPT